jgi:hypothetical protein
MCLPNKREDAWYKMALQNNTILTIAGDGLYVKLENGLQSVPFSALVGEGSGSLPLRKPTGFRFLRIGSARCSHRRRTVWIESGRYLSTPIAALLISARRSCGKDPGHLQAGIEPVGFADNLCR